MSVVALETDVVAAADGDAQAYTRLVSTHRNLVCSIALAIVGDVGASEDIAQGVFVAGWRSLATLRNPASFQPWLRQLTRNQAHQHVRTEGRRRRRVSIVDDDQLERAIDPAPHAEDRLVELEEREALVSALEQLPDSTREIVTLYYREGRSVDQVATLLGLRPAAVKKRLERARAALRAEMLDRFGDVVKRTAPTAAFVAAVTSAFVIAAPANAAAAGAATAAQTAKTFGLWKALAAILPGAALGLALGLSGIAFGTVLGLRKARDDEERRALLRLALFTTVNVLVFLAAIVLAGVLASPVLLVAGYVVAMIWFYYLYRVRLVRIVERRWHAEEADDPSSAARHQRERRRKLIGFLVGALGAGAGVISAVVQMLSA